MKAVRALDRASLSLYVKTEDKERLVLLARIWDTSQTEALRKAVFDALNREVPQ